MEMSCETSDGFILKSLPEFIRQCRYRLLSLPYNHPVLSWIEIDTQRLRANIDALKTVTVPGTSLMVVVKERRYQIDICQSARL